MMKCDGCSKEFTKEELDNPLMMCKSCVEWEVNEYNNGDKDIPEHVDLELTEEEINKLDELLGDAQHALHNYMDACEGIYMEVDDDDLPF